MKSFIPEARIQSCIDFVIYSQHSEFSGNPHQPLVLFTHINQLDSGTWHLYQIVHS